VGMLMLGVRRGTKYGRSQAVRVTDPFILWVMRLLTAVVASPTEPLAGLRCLGGYAYCFDLAVRALQLPLHFTPHGLRAGFVTDQWGHGVALEEIATVTRHISYRSLRIYLDVAAVIAGQAGNLLAGFLPRAQVAIDEVPGLLAHALRPAQPSSPRQRRVTP